MKAIYKREFKSYFQNMTGYVVVAFTLLILGVAMTQVNLNQSYANFEYAIEVSSFLFIAVVPMMTMRILVEDKRQRTDQLIFTAPVSMSEIVTGKYLATLSVFLIPCAVSCLYPLILSMYGKVELTTAYLAIFGFVLLGAALLSVGLFISSLTDNYIVSLVVSFGVMLAMYLIPLLVSNMSDSALASLAGLTVIALLVVVIIRFMTASTFAAVFVGCIFEIAAALLYIFQPAFIEGTLGDVLSWLAVFGKFSNFNYGLLDINGIVYYLSVIFFFIFLTVQSLEKRRWS